MENEKPEKRPPWRPTKYRPEMCRVAHDVLAKGGTRAHVAAELDVDEDTITTWSKKHPDFLGSIKRGLAKAQTHWVDEKHEGMHPSAWIFCMKNIFNWKDKQEIEQSGGLTVDIKMNMTGNDATPQD